MDTPNATSSGKMATAKLKKIDARTPAALKVWRRASGLTLDDVARRADVDPTWLSRAERDKLRRPMSTEQIDRIASAIEELRAERLQEAHDV